MTQQPMYSQPSSINMNPQGWGEVQYGSDANLVVIFYTRGVPDPIATKNAGTPWSKNVPYIKMHPVGEHLNVIDRPATDEDKLRFPRHWQKYVLGHTQIPDGTPIDLLFPNNPALADIMKGRSIYTVQQLANLSAHAIDSFGIGGQDYVNKAQNYLKNASGATGYHELQKQIQDRDQKIATLERLIQDQKAQIDDLFRKFTNPDAHSLNPSYQPGYDPQTERINANHATAQIVQNKQKAPLQGTAIQQPVSAPKLPEVPNFDIQEHQALQNDLPEIDLEVGF